MATSTEDTDITTCSAASSTISDCESAVTGGGGGGGAIFDPSPFFGASSPLVPLSAESREYVFLKHRLYASLELVGFSRCLVASVCRVAYPAERIAARARFEAFRLWAEDAAQEGRAAATRLAWYGAGSEEEVIRIAKDGLRGLVAEKDGAKSVRLWCENQVGNSIACSGVDSLGLRHILLCQVVIRGGDDAIEEETNQAVAADSKDNGVAAATKKAPNHYVVRSADAGTHVLPLYTIAIKMLSSKNSAPAAVRKKPTSPWIPLAVLVTMLSGRLPKNKVCLIKRLHNAYVERKISRQQMIQRVRQLSGDKILVAAIKAFQSKMMAMKKSASQRNHSRWSDRPGPL